MHLGNVFPSSVKDGKAQSELSTPISVNRDLTAVRATSTDGASRASILRVAFDLKGTEVALLPRIWKGHKRHLMSMAENLGPDPNLRTKNTPWAAA